MPAIPDPAVGGRIERIEVSNFKSYKGEQIIGPFRNFTAIIGPNGSGKSNLMDAISFVLGVRSVHLRGDKLRDLVYSLGDGDEEREARRAHVALVFVQTNGEELKMARAITGAGASEYRINGRVVTWDEYNNKLKSLGILVKARNFLVFQGDVESIASKNPRELTGLVEQISGSEEFRREYDRLAEDKAKAEESVAFSFQRKKNMTAEKKQRKEQKDEAERHLELQKELKDKKAENYLFQLYLNAKEADEAQEAKDEASAQLERVKGEQSELEAQSADKARDSAAKSRDVLAWEKKVVKKEAEIDRKRPEMLRLKEAQKRQQKKLKDSEKALEAKKEAAEKQRGEVDRLQRQLGDVQAELARQESEQDPASQVVRLATDQMEEYKEKKALVGTKTNKLRSDLKELSRKQQTDADARSQLQGNLAQMEERAQQLRGGQEQAQATVARVGADLEASRQQLQELRAEERRLGDANRTLKHRRDRGEAELEKAEHALREAKAERRESEHEQRMAEAVGTMKRLFPGVHGCLSELCKTTQRKYQLAAVVVMGKLFDAVAVEDENTAKECIQYLRDQRLPPMTFIPLSSARVKPVQERLRTLGGTSKLVIDILMFSEAIETAVLYAVGNTLVCDTLDEARALAWGRERNKVVTLDGTLLAKNGCMTGGTSGSMEERARRLQNFDQNIEELKERRDLVLQQLQQLGSAQEGLEKERETKLAIQSLETRIHYAEMELRSAEAKLGQATTDLAAMEAQRQRMEPNLAQLAGAISSREEELAQKQGRIDAITDRIFSDFCARVGVANIREYEDEPLKQAEQAAEHRMQLQAQEAKLRSQLEYEQHRDLRGPVGALEEAMEGGRRELEGLGQQAQSLTETMDALNAELEKHRAKVAEMKALAEEAEEALQATAKQRSSLTGALGKAKRNVTAKETLLVQLSAKRRELLEACEMEQIQFKSAQGEPIPMEVDSGGGPSADAMSLRLDYSTLPQSYVRASLKKDAQEKLLEEIRASIEELSAELERTAPNLKALEQYEAVKEKEREVSEEFETIRRQAKAVTDSFLAIKNERTERFMRAFEHISGVIDRIYKDLTASRTHPLGGSAYLSLESDEEPFVHGIKFTAMPPTKRFRDMEQLSGGEKTVAALALLFSIHSFKPSPFFVLDEVDAALDNLNVAKVAAYIRAKSRDDAIHGAGGQAPAQQGSQPGSQLARADAEGPRVSGFQSVVISLKDQFFDKADALVGVYRDVNDSCSKVLTFDLDKYPAAA